MARLTHLNEEGEANMVDITSKEVTVRKAVAKAFLVVGDEVFEAVTEGAVPKGDVFAAARIAGIMASKRTPELIPMCHNIHLEHVSVDFDLSEKNCIAVYATAVSRSATGVEMEAMTAVTVSALTLYDMLKSLDKSMVIQGIHLATKSGGKSGDFKHPKPPSILG